MSLIDKVKANLKTVPVPVYAVACVVPGGFVALGIYILLRPEPKKPVSLKDSIEQMIAEEKNK